MNLKKTRPTVKWNLMLLAGRPLAMVGLLLIGYGLLTQTTNPVPKGISIVVIGFVVGWTGKIGKTLFEA